MNVFHATEPSTAPSSEGAFFIRRAEVFSADELRRAQTRIAHEIVEHNRGTENLVLIGLYTRGVPLANRIAKDIAFFESIDVPVGALDVSDFRDDRRERKVKTAGETILPVDITDKNVVLVDDVLYTGRTIRAALDALNTYGRPRSVQVAVLVDRGHRELPIRPDFVGKNLPTKTIEDVRVQLHEVDGHDAVELWGPKEIDHE